MFHKHYFDYFFEDNTDEQLLHAMRLFDARVQHIANVLKMHLPATEGMLGTIGVEPPPEGLKAYQGRNARSILEGKGPLGRRVLEHIRIHGRLFAKPLEQGFEYGWASSYQEAFVKKISTDNADYQKINQLRTDFATALRVLGKDHPSIVAVEPENDMGLGVSMSQCNGSVEFYYTHPFERLTFHWENLVVAETLDRLHAEFWEINKAIRDADFSQMELDLLDLYIKCCEHFPAERRAPTLDLVNVVTHHTATKVMLVASQTESGEPLRAVHYARKDNNDYYYHGKHYSAFDPHVIERWKILDGIRQGMQAFLDGLEQSKENQGGHSDEDHAWAYFKQSLVKTSSWYTENEDQK